ncbi:MAG: 3-oxoacyl-ACP synthase [Rhizobacter sp.]
MTPLVITATGSVTPIGTRAWQTATSMSARLSAFTRQPIAGHIDHRATISRVKSIEPDCIGIDRLVRLAAPALFECLGAAPSLWPLARPLPLFIALPESRADLSDHISPQRFALELPRALDLAPEYLPLKMFVGGSVAGADALAAAYQFMHDHPEVPEVLIGGVDSLADLPVVHSFYKQGVLNAKGHTDGFIASEAAAFVRLARAPQAQNYVTVYPPAFGREEKSRLGSQDLLTGDALIDATTNALQGAQMPADALHAYWCDIDGSPWRGNELTGLSAALAPAGGLPPVQAPAAFMGDIGAAWVPLLLSLFHEQRQRLHHPLFSTPGALGMAGHGGLQTVTDHGQRTAAWVTTWGFSRKAGKLPESAPRN